MRQIIAKIMAFVLIAGCVAPAWPARQVWAAAKLNVNAGQGMQVGVSSVIPVGPNATSGEEQAVISWAADQGDSGYVLEYPLYNGRTVRITFTKDGDGYQVFYQILTTAGTPVNEDATLKGTTNYQVYSSTQRKLVTVAEFLNSTQDNTGLVLAGDIGGINIYPEPTYVSAAPDNFTLPPSFLLSGTEAGVSFQYMGINVHIKRVGDNIYVATDMLRKGYIYEMTLTNSPAPVVASTAKVFTGFDLSNVKVEPTAAGHTQYWADILEQGDETAEEPVGVELTIPLPMVWDDTTNAYVTMAQADVPNMILYLKDVTAPAGDMRVTINVNTPASSTVEPTTACTVEVELDGNGNVIVKLGGLNVGVIFEETTLTLATGSVGAQKTTNLPPDNPVYTFMKYTYSFSGGVDYIVAQAYPGENGHYELRDGTGNLISTTGADKTWSAGEEVFLPLPVSQVEGVYYITFVPLEGKELKSQQQKFTSTPLPPVNTPTDFTVLSHTLTPQITDDVNINYEHGDLLMTLRWDIGNVNDIAKLLDEIIAAASGNTDLEKLEIVYNLEYAQTPRDDPDDDSPVDPETFTEVLVTVTRNSTTNELQYTIAGTSVQPDTHGDVVETTEPRSFTRIGDKIYVDVDYETLADKDTFSLGTAYFEYPGIYFLRAQPIARTTLDATTGLSALEVIAPPLDPSEYDSLTLDDFSKQGPPPPQNLVLDFEGVDSPKDEVAFHASWEIDLDKLDEFLRDSYGFGTSVDTEMTMTLYIAHDPELFTGNVDGVNTPFYDMEYHADSETAASAVNNRILNSIPFEFVPATDPRNLMLFSDVQPSDVYPTLNRVTVGPDYTPTDVTDDTVTPRDYLRDGYVVAVLIEYDRDTLGQYLSYILDNLDKNQKYYAYVDMFVKQTPPSTSGAWIGDLSMLSNMAAITTRGEKVVPDGQDKIPTAPEDLIVENVDMDNATLSWLKVPPIDENETIKYEIVRLKDNQMDSTMLDSRLLTLDEVLAVLPEEKLGLRMPDDESAAYVFNDTDDLRAYFTDNTLIPNTLYFYYVRTVKIGVDGSELYSGWNHVTVTTDPVAGPINLRIETGDDTYDPMTEVVISFDAPIVYDDEKLILNEKLGTVFRLEYQLKKDDEEWGEYVTMDAETLIESATQATEDGYSHFVYTITGLDPATGYSARVRMVDISSESTSAFSNVATFRTDMNQYLYDKDELTDDWMYFLKQEMEKLQKSPYWIIRDDSTSFEIVYRPGQFESVMNTAKDSHFMLPESNAGRGIYYIPKSCYESATKAEVGFSVSHGDMSVLIPPGAVDLGNNQAALDVLQKVKDKTYADYFVRVTINWGRAPETVEGEPSLSDMANVRLELVGSVVDIAKWDETIKDSVSNRLEELSALDRTKEYFRRRVDTHVTDEELSKFVMAEVSAAMHSLHAIAQKGVTRITRLTFPVTELDKPMAIVAGGIAPESVVRGFHRQAAAGAWAEMVVQTHGESMAIYSTQLGEYVFAGRAVNIPGIEQVEKGGAIAAIVAKYGLDDFLGKNTVIMENNATRLMVVGSVARMSGAPRGADPFEWMKANKGLTLSTRGAEGDISTQEALYLIMNLYETRTGTKVATIQIKNYNATASITGLDQRYKQSVRAAFETGIYSNGSMQPKAPVTIGEVLEMLGALDGKTRL